MQKIKIDKNIYYNDSNPGEYRCKRDQKTVESFLQKIGWKYNNELKKWCKI